MMNIGLTVIGTLSKSAASNDDEPEIEKFYLDLFKISLEI
jgi:hypothetical protein